MANTLNKVFLDLKDTSKLMTSKDEVVKLLRKADANFIVAYDTAQNQWVIIIRSDLKDEVLWLNYDRKERFINLCMTITDFDALVGAFIAATFCASQFDYISYHRGKNLFHASEFKSRNH